MGGNNFMEEKEARKLMESMGPHAFIRMLRYEYGIARKAIAGMMRVNVKTVSYYVEGRGEIKPGVLDNLLVALQDVELKRV